MQDACTSSTHGVAVRIEDVKRRPRDIMPKVAAWMGIADSEALYASTFNGIQYWEPVSSSTRPITGFDTASMDKPLGRLFGPRDLIIMETLFYPMLVLYGYAEPNDAKFQSDMAKIEPWLNEPLEFERRLFSQYQAQKSDIRDLPAYRELHTALRCAWKMLRQGFDTKQFLYPLLEC